MHLFTLISIFPFIFYAAFSANISTYEYVSDFPKDFRSSVNKRVENFLDSHPKRTSIINYLKDPFDQDRFVRLVFINFLKLGMKDHPELIKSVDEFKRIMAVQVKEELRTELFDISEKFFVNYGIGIDETDMKEAIMRDFLYGIIYRSYEVFSAIPDDNLTLIMNINESTFHAQFCSSKCICQIPDKKPLDVLHVQYSEARGKDSAFPFNQKLYTFDVGYKQRVLTDYLKALHVNSQSLDEFFKNSPFSDQAFDTLMRLKHLQILQIVEPMGDRTSKYLSLLNDYRFFLRMRLFHLLNDDTLFIALISSQSLVDFCCVWHIEKAFLDKVTLEFQAFADIDSRIDDLKNKGSCYNLLLMKLKGSKGILVPDFKPESINLCGQQVAIDEDFAIKHFAFEYRLYSIALQNCSRSISKNKNYPFRSDEEERKRRIRPGTGPPSRIITLTIPTTPSRDSGNGPPITLIALVVIVLVTGICLILQKHIKMRKEKSQSSASVPASQA